MLFRSSSFLSFPSLFLICSLLFLDPRPRGFLNGGIRWVGVRAPMAPIVILTRHWWRVSLEVWVLTIVEVVDFDDGGSVG